MSQQVQFLLPDLLTICALQGGTNPHYREAGAESAAWINSYNVFTDRKRAYFIHGFNELLVSHTYPYAGYEEFRTCCDFVNLLFVVDEVSDDQTGIDAHATGKLFLDVMINPQLVNDTPLARMTRDFRDRYSRLAGVNCSKRFLNHCEDYVEAVGQEAELRERSEVLDLKSFMPLRRENSAVRLCFSLIEYAQGIDLPDDVFLDQTFHSAYMAGIDLVCWANDVYSYNMEQAKGHSGNNILTVLMKEKKLGLQAACDFVGRHSAELMESFIVARSSMPSWGSEVDSMVTKYLDGIAHWVRGNLEWSFETYRYFGPDHQKIKGTRLVTLRPQGDPEDFDSESDGE